MRTLSNGLILPAGPPIQVPRSYQILSDGTLWYLSIAGGVDWRQLTAPPSVTITYVYAVANPLQYPDCPDTLFVSDSGGTIWSAAYPYGSPTGQPLAWTPVTTIPQPTG